MDEPHIISKVTSKSQTVIPLAIRRKLGIKPGDVIRYHVRGNHVEIQKISTGAENEDPFATFTEWGSSNDDEAYKDI